MYQLGYILLVFQGSFQWVYILFQARYIWFINCFKGDWQIIVLHVLDKQHGMIAFFLCLYLVPVCKAIQPFIVIKIGKAQIQVSRIELLVDLRIQQLGNFFIQHIQQLLFAENRVFNLLLVLVSLIILIIEYSGIKYKSRLVAGI